jgi:hypothetical protein
MSICWMRFACAGCEDSRNAATYYYAEHVDGVLIYQDDAQRGRIIGRDMKSLFPSLTFLYVTQAEQCIVQEKLDAAQPLPFCSASSLLLRAGIVSLSLRQQSIPA